jgi:exopolysaccharide biosynthesis polyprenyl glycosylphosphotransferase
MKPKRDRYVVPLLILFLADSIGFVSGMMGAFAIRFSYPVTALFPPIDYPSAWLYLKLGLFIALVGVVCFDRFGIYAYRYGLKRSVSVTGFLVAVIVTYVFVMAALFNYRGVSFSRMTVAFSVPLTVFMLVSFNLLCQKAYELLIQRGIGFTRTVLLGDLDSCQMVLDRLYTNRGSEYQVAGIIRTGAEEAENPGAPLLGKLSDLDRILKERSIEHLLIALSEKESDTALHVIRKCKSHGIRFQVLPEIFDALSMKMDIEELGYVPTISLGETPLQGGARFVKRGIDVILASVMLIVASPIMAVIATLIRLDSKGSILFVQQRIGNDGRVFNMFKFRSMIRDAEAGTGPVWATSEDPRQTRVGKWIRQYSLDELPQLFNVLVGDMSIVGPRPERAFFVNKFKESVPKYMRRHMVKSGITGWAQVNGLRGDTSVEERTRYDIYYIENWSLLLDLRILLRTLLAFKNAH